MNNEKGYSFVEMILTVSVLFLLFASLLPFCNHMMMKLAEKKVSVHVAISKNQAATAIMNGKMAGNIMINGIDYKWDWNQPDLCVRYSFLGESHESCDTY